MLLSFKQAMMLFRKWHRDYSWIYVQARLDDKDIEYLFWGQLLRVSEREVCFAGIDVVLPIAVTGCTFEHINASRIPQIVLQRFRETDCCVFMRFGNGSALLYGRETMV